MRIAHSGIPANVKVPLNFVLMSPIVFRPYFLAVDVSTETESVSKNGVWFNTVKPRDSSNAFAALNVAAADLGDGLWARSRTMTPVYSGYMLIFPLVRAVSASSELPRLPSACTLKPLAWSACL
jgi:hypothetical protein